MTGTLQEHLSGGLTTVCRCWRLKRQDGSTFGFTDHDLDLTFDGQLFRADAGMSPRALVAGTGLSVDNSEVLGVLGHASVREEDIAAGRFDGAEVEAYLVNWQNPVQRSLRFRGTIGEIRRSAGAFHAELRGLTQPLNLPQGRVFQPVCGAALGDQDCRVNLGAGSFRETRAVSSASDRQVFGFLDLDLVEDRWFERGVVRVLTGAAAGLMGTIKSDSLTVEGGRSITLWEPLGAALGVGDFVTMEAGCDKRAETCRQKFGNIVNFRGFPTIPTEDWLLQPVAGVAGAG